MIESKPAYKIVYEKLRRQIVDGVFKEGYLLPSENDLVKTYKITRPTIRKALDMLVNEGYIVKHQGKGSIVRTEPKELGIMSIEGVTKAMGSENLTTRIINKPEIQNWPAEFFYTLSEDELDMGVIRMSRLRLVNNIPVFFDENYLPNMNIPRFCNRNFENRSLFTLLREKYDVEIKGGEQRLRAIPADKKISDFLHIKKKHPVLLLQRKLTTNRKAFNIYSSLYCNTEAYALHGSF